MHPQSTRVAVPLATFTRALDLSRKFEWREPQDGQRTQQIRTSVDDGGKIQLAYATAVHKRRDYMPHVYRPPLQCVARLVYTSQSSWPQPRATGGYCVLGGELIALHSTLRGQGLWLLDAAINDGSDHLMCHDVPHLLKLYSSRGFYVTKRAPDLVPGRPDVVWMERDA